MKHQTSHLPRDASEQTLVIYDPSSGDIVHAHTEVTLVGCDFPSTAELKRRALATARQFLKDDSRKLRAIAVDRGTLNSGFQYRVDIKSGELRSLESGEGVADSPTTNARSSTARGRRSPGKLQRG